MRYYILLLLFFSVISFSNNYSQNCELSLKNAKLIDSKTFEFDIFIKAVAPTESFTLTAYQVALSLDQSFTAGGSLTFNYINSSTSLSNKPIFGIGVQYLDQIPKLTFASALGYDNVQSNYSRIGSFRLSNTKSFVTNMVNIKLDFNNNIRTILLTTDLVEIPKVGTFITLDYANPFEIIALQLEFDLKILLEAPYIPGSKSAQRMTSQLGSSISLGQPFNKSPWNYSGTESVSSIPSNITDWALIELRSDKTQIEFRKAVFIRNDGHIVNLDGSKLKISAESGSYYVVVKTRNHLAVMSAEKLELSAVFAKL